MKRAALSHKVHTKISDEEFAILCKVCEDYGFKSIYQILQTLLRTFIRSLGKEYREGCENGIAKEITDMFDDLATAEEQPKVKCKTGTYKENY